MFKKILVMVAYLCGVGIVAWFLGKGLETVYDECN